MSGADERSLEGMATTERQHAPAGWRVKLLQRLLSGLTFGHLRVTLPSGAHFDIRGSEEGPEAVLVIHRWRMLWRCLAGGDIGFAESYLDHDWSSPDLTALIRLMLRNSAALEKSIRGARFIETFNRFRHALRANSRKGSRKNIEFHYDLGNAFYRLWLDRSMMYSSAIWTDEQLDLEGAQQARLERISQLLALSAGDSVLEIGCGWGALAAHLARHADAHVTGITLSPSQLEWASTSIATEGLSEKVALRLQDYRDLDTTFDRVVSIEMLEAVGEAYLPGYFDTIAKSLKPGGIAVLQGITIEESRFEDYRSHPDFIQKHVFPGGFLPTRTLLNQLIANAGLKLTSAETFATSYARTLAEWHRRFLAHWPEIAALGFDARFKRLWEYYLSYCEGGFLEGSIDVGLYVIRKPEIA
ncbi:MAG: SAM-dependent methyltransferase [Rhizobiales bacterium PAR1]|nr:MAG: SAM-dependent methyltransferase [Rhizobiales bacterium PAR1]